MFNSSSSNFGAGGSQLSMMSGMGMPVRRDERRSNSRLINSRETTSKDFSISNDSVTDTSSLAPTETAIVRSVSHNESRRTSERGVLTPPRAASVAQSNTGDGTNDSRPRPRYIRGRKGPVDSIWLPHSVVKGDRWKAKLLWTALLCGAVVYVVILYANAKGRRSNPPVTISTKEELFGLPDVIFCPAAGDGCDAGDPEECARRMTVVVSALSGFKEDASDFTATLPVPTSTSSAVASSTTPSPVAFWESADAEEPSVIRLPSDTTAHSWCPVIPLSSLSVDTDAVDSGEVQSLHASVYVTWSDEVAKNPLPSTRRLLNTFILDADGELEDATLSRLLYDRVEINGSEPFTFVSNDVTLGMSERLSLSSESAQRSYTQVAVSAPHTLALEDADMFEGAFLYATFNINGFTYRSVQEVDPVDMLRLIGAAGGILVMAIAFFKLLFVQHRSDPSLGKVWRFSSKKKRRRSNLDFRSPPRANQNTETPPGHDLRRSSMSSLGRPAEPQQVPTQEHRRGSI